METAAILTRVLVILLAAVLVVPLFQRLRLSAVLGYLAAGAAIGPAGLGLIEDPEATRALADLGIVFLLFTLGLELSLERLRGMGRHLFGLGAAQVLATALALGGGAWLLGASPAAAAVIGLGLAMSSTAAVLQILSERGELVDRVGRLSFAILLFQDMAVAPILAVTPLLGAEDVGNLVLALALAALKAVAAVAVILLLGRLALRPVFALAARGGNREVFVGLALLVALGTGWATQEVGLSMALGAFLSGLVLAGTEYRHQIEADIEPYRGLLLGLFFMTVGMSLDPRVAAGELPLILAIVVGLAAVKAAIVILLARAFAVARPLAIRVGLLLAEGGEFAFVVFSLARANGLLDPRLEAALVVAVALSMTLTPAQAALGARLGGLVERRLAAATDRLAEEAAELSDHVVIAGYGRVGQTVSRLLGRQGIAHVALDLDSGRVTAARQAGAAVFYGNAAQFDVLRRAGVERARAVIVTLDHPATVERLVTQIHQHCPELAIVARARDGQHGRALARAGASVVVPETLEASLQLGRAALEAAGTPDAAADDLVDRIRGEQYALLETIIPSGGNGSFRR